jgi:hypothetical protein
VIIELFVQEDCPSKAERHKTISRREFISSGGLIANARRESTSEIHLNVLQGQKTTLPGSVLRKKNPQNLKPKYPAGLI